MSPSRAERLYNIGKPHYAAAYFDGDIALWKQPAQDANELYVLTLFFCVCVYSINYTYLLDHLLRARSDLNRLLQIPP